MAVNNGTTYYYVVSANTSQGESANSQEVAALPLANPPAAVAWANGAGVTVSANSLTKSDANAAWSAGASSQQALASGDGYVEFTVNETNTYRMLGLSSGDSDQTYSDIDFALYPAADGNLYVYEGGVYKAGLGPYASGDHLRVAVESGTVRYRKNGTLLYSSLGVPLFPLLVDTSLYSPGATLSNAVIAGNLTAAVPGSPVTWTRAVGVNISGNRLHKNDPNASWLAGASSLQSLVAGDGYVDFTVNQTNTYRMIGLSNGDTDQSYGDIDFALYPAADSNLYVYEGGVYKASLGAYAGGDHLRVAVNSGVVRYYKNGALLFTSTGVPTYPLLVDTSLYTPDATINNVLIAGNWQ
jgi:hypothetical protein